VVVHTRPHPDHALRVVAVNGNRCWRWPHASSELFRAFAASPRIASGSRFRVTLTGGTVEAARESKLRVRVRSSGRPTTCRDGERVTQHETKCVASVSQRIATGSPTPHRSNEWLGGGSSRADLHVGVRPRPVHGVEGSERVTRARRSARAPASPKLDQGPSPGVVRKGDCKVAPRRSSSSLDGGLRASERRRGTIGG
jgi:hypothetical protein